MKIQLQGSFAALRMTAFTSFSAAGKARRYVCNMRCPICKQSVAGEGNPFRPFCSERCKLIDLDNWLEGRYRVPAPLDPDEENAAEESMTDSKGELD